MTTEKSLLFNPHTHDPTHFDDETRRPLRATIDWFKHRGKGRLLEDSAEFAAKERLFAKLGTQAREANTGPTSTPPTWC
jgi:acyl-CoA dehydrogenase